MPCPTRQDVTEQPRKMDRFNQRLLAAESARTKGPGQFLHPQTAGQNTEALQKAYPSVQSVVFVLGFRRGEKVWPSVHVQGSPKGLSLCAIRRFRLRFSPRRKGLAFCAIRGLLCAGPSVRVPPKGLSFCAIRRFRPRFSLRRKGLAFCAPPAGSKRSVLLCNPSFSS